MSAITTTTRRGVSLARGPALLIGTVLIAAGLFFLYRIHNFPPTSGFPSHRVSVTGHAFFGIFGINGWSGELTAAAGGLLLFGAAQHVLAKFTSLVVALALAAVAVIALVHHHSALGLFAANIWTIVLWGASAAALAVNSLLPRAGSSVVVEQAEVQAVGAPPAPEPIPARPVSVPARPVPVPVPTRPSARSAPPRPMPTPQPAPAPESELPTRVSEPPTEVSASEALTQVSEAEAPTRNSGSEAPTRISGSEEPTRRSDTPLVPVRPDDSEAPTRTHQPADDSTPTRPSHGATTSTGGPSSPD